MLLLSNGSKNGPRTHFLHADGKIKHAHFAEVKQDFSRFTACWPTLGVYLLSRGKIWQATRHL